MTAAPLSAAKFDASTKTIAVDLDDTLNNFTETLLATEFRHDGSYSFSQETFDGYLARIRSQEPDPSALLSTEFSFFKYRIHHRCFELAQARADGVAFMRRLRADGWRIVICTYRDLRRANDITRKWLEENGIPFDHLFMAWNKIVFCKAWGIRHLVDDHSFNTQYGATYGVNVYFPIHERREDLSQHGAKGFRSFDELVPWIQG
jgi:5'(3')-deoxyribonucleotidase